jgi:tetrapyrrole methylase family protein/MazG family protein
MSSFDSVVSVCRILGVDPLSGGLQLIDASDPGFDDRGPVSPTDHPVGEGGEPIPTADGAWCEVQGIGPYVRPALPYPLAPSRPALICRLATPKRVVSVRAALLERYPAEHPIRVVDSASGRVEPMRLGQLDRRLRVDPQSYLFVPELAPLADLRGPEGITYVVARLLGPRGCPWDCEQTHRTLRAALLEETYEALEAIDADDMAALAEELGDVLLSVLMHSEMGRQAGAFDLGTVYTGIATKLIGRHPHIFGALAREAQAFTGDSERLLPGTTSGEVLQNWEAIKRAERAAKGQEARGVLDGIPVGLPALPTAQELTRKAARAGFDSPVIEDVWNKLQEEFAELREADQANESGEARLQRLSEELGDLLLAAAKLAWRLHIDAESALREANTRFRRRFAVVERMAAEQMRDLHTLSVEEKLALWRQAKNTL